MSNTKNTGGAAFPLPIGSELRGPGMTLRDYFAAQVLQGMHARDRYDPELATPQQRALLAYIDADAMLKAREQ